MKRVTVLFAGVLIALVGVGGSVQGSLINIVQEDYPDIFSAFINVVYDADTDEFVAEGNAFTLNDGSPGPAIGIDGGTIKITAVIDDSGILSGGMVMVEGTTGGGASLGYNSGTLLTGDLTDFGFATNGADLLEFVFDVTGGDAADLYGDAPAGIILSFGGFSGSFDADFDNTGSTPGIGFAVAGIAPIVPEPATLGLLLLGSAAIVRRRK